MEFSAVKMPILVTYTKPQPFYLHLFFKWRELECQKPFTWFTLQATSVSWPVLQTYSGAAPKHAENMPLSFPSFTETHLTNRDLSNGLSTTCCIFPAHKAFHWPSKLSTLERLMASFEVSVFYYFCSTEQIHSFLPRSLAIFILHS